MFHVVLGAAVLVGGIALLVFLNKVGVISGLVSMMGMGENHRTMHVIGFNFILVAFIVILAFLVMTGIIGGNAA